MPTLSLNVSLHSTRDKVACLGAEGSSSDAHHFPPPPKKDSETGKPVKPYPQTLHRKP